MTTNGATPAPQAGHNYAENPLLVYWETTLACALACRHCRAEAQPTRHPFELTRAESRRLLCQIAGFGQPLPHLVLTGGDPLARPDLFELIDDARSRDINVSITPSATPNLTRETIEQLQAHGIQSLGLSLDGSTGARHDAIRGVAGCFDLTMRALADAEELGIPVQINTLVTAETVGDLPAVYELLKGFDIMRWSLFFLIGTGRGAVLRELSPEDGEAMMHWVYDLSLAAPFAIKTTEAPSYRRVALGRMRDATMAAGELRRSSVYRGFGIRDGHGIVFVSNTGMIYPSGFLPISAGNVRKNDLVTTYRSSPLFRFLHDPDQFRGKCGRCEYRKICGGSRARAFATSGDPLESDPFCPYQPQQG